MWDLPRPPVMRALKRPGMSSGGGGGWRHRTLKVGEKVRLDNGLVYRVSLVNDCRARLVCLGKKHQVVRDRDTGEVLAEFEAPASGPQDVSPQAIVERVD